MNVYINLIVFILTTVYYFYSKPITTFNQLQNTSLNSSSLGIYCLLILLTQFALNIWIIIDKCGGSASQNIGTAALFTFLPWILLFGIVIVVILVFPGFKTAFSDVIGYFYISEQAHILFSEMLAVKGEIKTKLASIPETENDKKNKITTIAEVLIKLFGNVGILINQIVPSNFTEYWELIKPLMKDSKDLEKQSLYLDFKKKQTETSLTVSEKSSTINGGSATPTPTTSNEPENNQTPTNPQSGNETNDDVTIFYRDELLKLVITRDNVGEFMWYLYTGILVISIVQFYIINRGCVSDSATMQKNYQTFLEKEQDIQNKQEIVKNVIYTTD